MITFNSERSNPIVWPKINFVAFGLPTDLGKKLFELLDVYGRYKCIVIG